MIRRVTVRRLGHLGDGIAPSGAEGDQSGDVSAPVLVPGALPGEVVEGTLGDGPDGTARMSAARIVTPSPDRVRPPCPHARRCGGCALQHARDAFVADWKQEVVRRALAGQGMDTVFRPLLTSPAGSRRRAVLAGRRTKKGVLVGFHARGSDTIVPIGGCILLHPDLMAALSTLEAVTAALASRSATLSLTLTRSDTGLDLAIVGAPPVAPDRVAALAEIAAAAGIVRVSAGPEVLVQSALPTLCFGPARVVPPPGAFLQATAEGEAALLAAVGEAVGDAGSVADLFAGCGTFALPLAARCPVHAVEGDARMVAALVAAARHAPGLRPVTTEVRDLFRRPLSADELSHEAVVIDPPRAGAEAQMAELAASRVARVAAVSCNPVTFARDARILADGGYRLRWVQVVDQFRWSTHVELAALFTKGDIGDIDLRGRP